MRDKPSEIENIEVVRDKIPGNNNNKECFKKQKNDRKKPEH